MLGPPGPGRQGLGQCRTAQRCGEQGVLPPAGHTRGGARCSTVRARRPLTEDPGLWGLESAGAGHRVAQVALSRWHNRAQRRPAHQRSRVTGRGSWGPARAPSAPSADPGAPARRTAAAGREPASRSTEGQRLPCAPPPRSSDRCKRSQGERGGRLGALCCCAVLADRSPVRSPNTGPPQSPPRQALPFGGLQPPTCHLRPQPHPL